MSGMRSGFRGMFKGGKKNKKSDPKNFLTMLLVTFAVFALVFFMTR